MAIAHTQGYSSFAETAEWSWAPAQLVAGEPERAKLDSVSCSERARLWALQVQAGADYVAVNLGNAGAHGRLPWAGTDVVAAHFPAQHGAAPNGDSGTLRPAFALRAGELLGQIKAAQVLGYKAKPVVLGPVSYLFLLQQQQAKKSAFTENVEFNGLELLPRLLPIYQQLLEELRASDVDWVQIDEPILTQNLPAKWREALRIAYKNLQEFKLGILLSTGTGALADNLTLVQELAVDGLHIDGVAAVDEIARVVLAWPAQRVLSIGIVNANTNTTTPNDLRASLAQLGSAHKKFGSHLWISTNAALAQQAFAVDGAENFAQKFGADESIAQQKWREVTLLTLALNCGLQAIESALAESDKAVASQRNTAAISAVKTHLNLGDKTPFAAPECAA